MSLFSTPAYAQDATGGMFGNLAGLSQFLPIVLIFVVFYFLLIRPQQQRRVSASSRFTRSTTLKNRPRAPSRMQARAIAIARWVLPVPVPPTSTTLR